MKQFYMLYIEYVGITGFQNMYVTSVMSDLSNFPIDIACDRASAWMNWLRI